jgi:hypothetical protein
VSCETIGPGNEKPVGCQAAQRIGGARLAPHHVEMRCTLAPAPRSIVSDVCACAATATSNAAARNGADVRRITTSVYVRSVSDAKRTPYRQAGAPSARKARGTVVSRAEEPELEQPVARAPLARPPADPDAGVFSGLVSPHPASTESEWAAQVALTMVSLPLLTTTFVMVGWLDMRRAYGQVQLGEDAPRPWGIAHPIAWVVGAIPLALSSYAREWPEPLAIALIGIPFAALLARRRLRQRIVDREALLETMRKRKR